MAATKILVVDDEPDIEVLIRQRFAKQLKSQEMDFVFASNGSEALKALYQDEQIHVVLTDINMPEMDGLALLSHLQGFDRILKTVIISAYGDMSNIRKAMSCGAADFITKPIDFQDLETTIFHAVEQCLSLEKTLESQKELVGMEKEWAIARGIQESMLPSNFNPFPGRDAFEIQGTVLPGTLAGGDFIDFFPLDLQRLAFVMADVSGKSIPAVFFMAMTRLLIRGSAQKARSPSKCLDEVNRFLSIDNPDRLFARVFYGIYDLESGMVEYANAGHPPPLVLPAGDPPLFIHCREGIPLGIHHPYDYTECQFQLNRGDGLLLYSDGLLEARNSTGQEYGKERLVRPIEALPSIPFSQWIARVLGDLAQFVQDTPYADDRALLCLRRSKEIPEQVEER